MRIIEIIILNLFPFFPPLRNRFSVFFCFNLISSWEVGQLCIHLQPNSRSFKSHTKQKNHLTGRKELINKKYTYLSDKKQQHFNANQTNIHFLFDYATGACSHWTGMEGSSIAQDNRSSILSFLSLPAVRSELSLYHRVDNIFFCKTLHPVSTENTIGRYDYLPSSSSIGVSIW